MNNAEILAKSLLDLGVEHIFGFSGATILPVFHAIGSTPINITVCANEQACAFAAEGYSRASEKVGIAVVTSGPAITNTLTAVADAHADSIPMLVFAGQVAQTKMDTDEFQHIKVSSVFADAAKKVILVNEMHKIEEVVKDAYFFATSGKPGPVVIDFPYDIQRTEGEYTGIATEKFAAKYDEERHLGENQCRRFFQLLKGAKKPLLYIGGGLNSQAASDKIRAFNHRFAVPSINSLMGKGILDETKFWAVGMLGMFGVPAANKAIQETDLFVAFGIRWDDRVSQKVGEAGLDADIAYFDINPHKVQEVRFTREPKFSFIGDAQTVIDDLLNYALKHDIRLDIGPWQERIKQLKSDYPLDYNRQAQAIQQAEVMEHLAGLVTPETKVTTGVGNHQMLAAQYLTSYTPKSFLTAGGFGPMGFSLPAAIGAYYAAPRCTVIAIDGDGSLLMNLGELFTIGREQLPIKVLLLNNHGDGMVRNIQDFLYDGEYVGTMKKSGVHFANVARELGFPFQRRIEKREELQAGLRDFMSAAGPAFLEVVCDEDEVLYPRIHAGSGYQDMIMGPFMEEEKGYA